MEVTASSRSNAHLQENRLTLAATAEGAETEDTCFLVPLHVQGVPPELLLKALQ